MLLRCVQLSTSVQVRPAASECPSNNVEVADLQELFSDSALQSDRAQRYEDQIVDKIVQHQTDKGVVLGACLIEPVMQASGGMVFVDPLFQKVLIHVRSCLRLCSVSPCKMLTADAVSCLACNLTARHERTCALYTLQ
jgi:adenosylmethionine-8-amino-7-oxononanoate aminotransferase